MLLRRLTVDSRYLVLGGLVLSALGLVPFAVADATGGTVLLLAGQFVQGLGTGATMLPIMTLAMASLARAEVPRASAAFSVVQRVGAPFGVTVIAVLLQSAIGSSGLSSGFSTAFWWTIALSAVPFLLALLLPSARRAAPVPEVPEPVAV